MWKKINNVIVLDFETTGLSPVKDYPTEVGFLLYNLEFMSEMTYSSMIKLPKGVEIPEFITELTGLTTEKVNNEGADKEKIRKKLFSLINDKTLFVAHNANFDLGFLQHHFGIEPKYFMCTRTIEFFTNPEYPLSLEATYERYLGKFVQKHRALADVQMTFEVFKNQKEVHDFKMDFFLNKMVVTPERGLVYYPDNANVLDYTIGRSIR